MRWKLLRQKSSLTEKSSLNPRTFVNKKGAQEAHEAIRPTDMSRHTRYRQRPSRLYDLIWKGWLSQMSDAQLERTNVKNSSK
jgi:DNA topoisomerase-1